MVLKPWREVVSPHQDVLDGHFQEASFAADLTKVVLGVAPAEYQDPVQFFERTVITEGMSLLLQSVVKRLGNRGGDPVVQLQTAFGGGKTHTMLAVLHVARAQVPASSMFGVSALLDKAAVPELVPAKVAVLDGNALAPSEAKKHGAIEARTLWGELAWQLAGDDGYALVARSDEEGTSPGKDVLKQLFALCGPCVILLDEVVAYLRQFAPNRSYVGGSYNSNLSFLQALTEAAAGTENCMVLASLPESDVEVGDASASLALSAVQKIFGRIEAVWKPVATDEAFEIVRRRLFTRTTDAEAVDAVVRAFQDLYATKDATFPSEARDARYAARMRASYPIHPEVFERLYEDWSTLPSFQRTRGVLRLMARLVHSLWRSGNKDLLILPASIPLDDITVRNELVKYLAAGWEPIVDKDVDGPNAQPRRIDSEVAALGSIEACRRAARTIFLASAPSVGAQSVRGIGVERIRLGCTEPGQSPGKYDDALRRLTDRLHYLYSGNDRFWFDLRPNLRREMEDRMLRYDDVLDIHPEVEARLQKDVKSKWFANVHVFKAHKEIPDKVDLRLVVLGPDFPHKRRDENSSAIGEASRILENSGERPRDYRNRVLFLAADATSRAMLLDQCRRFLAWRSIVAEQAQLNLDEHLRKEAQRSLTEASARLDGAIREAYRLLLAPRQDVSEEGTPLPIEWEDDALALAGTSYEAAIDRVIRDRVWIVGTWAATHLKVTLERWFFRERGTVGVDRFWRDSCRFIYLERLANVDTLLATIREGVVAREFAFAANEDANGFQGLTYGNMPTATADATALLLRSSGAEAILEERQAAAELAAATRQVPQAAGTQTSAVPSRDNASVEERGPASTRSKSAPPRPKIKYVGAIDIDAPDPIGHFAEIAKNVIAHLTAVYGAQVRIRVDIEAIKPDGFDAKTVRTVSENGVQLKMELSEFD